MRPTLGKVDFEDVGYAFRRAIKLRDFFNDMFSIFERVTVVQAKILNDFPWNTVHTSMLLLPATLKTRIERDRCHFNSRFNPRFEKPIKFTHISGYPIGYESNHPTQSIGKNRRISIEERCLLDCFRLALTPTNKLSFTSPFGTCSVEFPVVFRRRRNQCFIDYTLPWRRLEIERALSYTVCK